MAGPQLHLDRDFDPAHGQCVVLAPGLARLTAPNADAFTFHGTNTYLLGEEQVTIVDPGPDDPSHLDAIFRAVGDRPVDAIAITHTHVDHTALLPALRRVVDGPVIGCAPHAPARALAAGEVNALDAAGDKAYAPDRLLADGDTFETDGAVWRAVETPGHTMNHLCFWNETTGALLSGDHIMAWSTSIIAPPDGKMSAYMASLEILRDLDLSACWPGHGGPVTDPRTFIAALIAHRHGREQAALRALEKGPQRIADMVPAIYIGLDPQLHRAAALSLFAQLEDLVEREIVAADGPPTLEAVYRLG